MKGALKSLNHSIANSLNSSHLHDLGFFMLEMIVD